MYHYGITIKEYREKHKVTQQYLADKWPKSERFGGGEGVSLTYIQDIEHGRKRIDDQQTLRKVCLMLCIPLWRVGLGGYDPFTETVQGSSYHQTFDVLDTSLRQIWILRQAGQFILTRELLGRLTPIFHSFQNGDTPPMRHETRYVHLLADYQCVSGVVAVDAGQYVRALQWYGLMHETAVCLDDPAVIAHSLMNLGVEHDRLGDTQQSVRYLEEARDYSFETSKAWSVIIHSYLSRAYASSGDAFHFHRANDTAARLSSYLTPDFSQDTDEVYYTLGNILAERSAGYLALREPQRTLDMRGEITCQAMRDHDTRLQTWLYLDYARAYAMLGEIEQAVMELRTFYGQARAMGSRHAVTRAGELVQALERKHGEVGAVREFSEEYVTDESSETV